jgi:BirA family transcriptional regulator, biotin operon repressor / biotin---[acetyl-CoA-carboxylase] ligase
MDAISHRSRNYRDGEEKTRKNAVFACTSDSGQANFLTTMPGVAMLGFPLYHLPSVISTIDEAKRLIQDGVPEGALVTADFQTTGRGRMDRLWESSPGANLLAAYILRPMRDPGDWGGLPLLAAVAMAETIHALSALTPRLKWPNDVLLNRKKVAGILIETGISAGSPWAVLGIGLNVNQTSFSGEYRLEPTSLARDTGAPYNLELVRDELSRHLTYWYERWLHLGNAPVVFAWRERTDMFGRNVLVEDGAETFVARAMDLHPDGTLLVRRKDGSLATVTAGDVTVRYE